ncbi:hypothetical protein B0H66DRAFT_590430 [Apodospora peruviana]|uniref:Uncharacterized protein n=1 Tax=Apodospora peruviana TaxID=516989 RepID=A0AAE0ID19_9PEZI|nr:hypothetical protein B0H66DRAFT_590430 [Apodospora peruviana]
MAGTPSEAELRQHMPNCTGISFFHGYAPVRTAKGKNNPMPSSSLSALWDSVAGTTPSTFSLARGNRINLQLYMNQFPANILGPGLSLWTFTGRVAGNPRITIQTNEAWESDYGEDPTIMCSVPAYIYFENTSDMPWGIREDIIWSASVVYNGTTTNVKDFLSTPVEIYAISPKLPTFYKGPGVPLELLQLFVEPACKDATVQNLDQWVAWVVKRCHASVADNGEDSTVQVPVADRIHSFRYDIWHGGVNYAGTAYGRTFDLDYWLQDFDKTAAWNMVNCYDQAGIVQLATLLGVPCDRIGWEYKEPFGYITSTDLVGWGVTNNPFYQNNHDLKVLDEADKPTKGSAFGNHAFISYTNSAGQRMALDACAGPHTGTETVEAYLTGGIDDTNDMTSLYYQTYGTKYNTPEAMLSITALEKDNGKGVETVNEDKDSYYTVKTTGGVLTYADLKNVGTTMASRWLEFAKFVQQPPTQSKKIDLGQFFVDFQAKVANRLPPATGSTAIFTLQRPRPQVVAEKTVSYQAGLDVTSPPPTTGGVSPTPQRPVVSLTVKVLDTADHALADVATYMQCLSRDPFTLFETPDASDDTRLGHLHLQAKSPNGLNIFLYENMVVWVETQDYQLGIDLAGDAERLMNAATGENAPLVPVITAPTSPVDSIFTVTVECPGAGEVEAMEDQTRLFPLGWTRVDDKWTFTFDILGSGLWTKDGDAVPETNFTDSITFVIIADKTGIAQAEQVDIQLSKDLS